MADKSTDFGQPGIASSLSRADVLRSLSAYEKLFNEIDDNRPEGDVRLRFLGLRAIRSNYVDGRVKQCGCEYYELMADVREGRLDPEAEDVQNRFEELMIALDKALDWSSTYLSYIFLSTSLILLLGRVLEQDSKAAKAPVVNPHFMNNIFRWNLELPGQGDRAPNGELKSLYGSRGDPVPSHFTTPRGCEDDLFRRFILNKVLVALDHRVYIPCRKLYNKLLGRDYEQEAHKLGGRVLEVIVSALETALSVLCVSGSVILLYNLNSMKERLIATTFLSLVFPYPVIFLSKEAMRMFALTAAYG